jgi:hypothetical protein
MIPMKWFHQYQQQLRSQHEQAVAAQASDDVAAERAAAARIARILAESVPSYLPDGAQVQRTYGSAADMATGIALMLPQGWQATGIREQQLRSGRLRAIALDAVDTLAFAPHAQAIVTFTRRASTRVA